ncbi:unnamed protein product [Bubo scandiacus]
MSLPDRLEDLEVVQQRFETLEPEMNNLASRVAAVNRIADQLLAAGRCNQEGARGTREQLNARWERFRALADQKKEALSSALDAQNFHLECDETTAWMREKTKVIESTQGLGNDLAGVTALQRKLSGMERDLEAIQGKRLDALDTGWEELGRMWENRHRVLAQAFAFQVFLRDSKQVEGVLSTQEYALSHAEMAATLPGAEAAVKKHEDFMATMEANGERVQGLVAAGRKLVAEGSPHAEKVQETLDSVESRHRRNRDTAQELLRRLRDNWELRRFLQDGKELTLWMEEKLLTAQDVSYEEARDLHAKWQKHEAFGAELAAHKGWLEKMEQEGRQLAAAKPELGAEVTGELRALRGLWEELEATTRAKARRLFEADRAELCAQACAALRLWLGGVRAQLRSDDYGKDLTGVNILLKKQQLLEAQTALREKELEALRAQALSGAEAEAQAQVRAVELQFAALREPLRERCRRLRASREEHQLNRDLEDEILWVQERRALATSTDHGKDLPSVQLLLKKNQTLQKELQGHERRVEELLGRRGELPAAERVRELREAWQELRLQAELRHRRLERALAAQQFYCDAAEAEAWMGEQELHMMAQEKAKVRVPQPGPGRVPVVPWPPPARCVPPQDELSAQAMLSKHLGLEQALRDYARTVQQLAAQSRDMVASGHPESERLRLRQAQVEKLYGGLTELAGGSGARRCRSTSASASSSATSTTWSSGSRSGRWWPASHELGQDYETRHGCSRCRRDAARLAKAYAGERAAELRRQERAVSEAWARLRGCSQTRRRRLLEAVEQFRFLRAARDLLLWMDGVRLQIEAQERPRDVSAGRPGDQEPPEHQGGGGGAGRQLLRRLRGHGHALLGKGHHAADKGPGAPRAREGKEKEREKRFSFFKKNK